VGRRRCVPGHDGASRGDTLVGEQYVLPPGASPVTCQDPPRWSASRPNVPQGAMLSVVRLGLAGGGVGFRRDVSLDPANAPLDPGAKPLSLTFRADCGVPPYGWGMADSGMTLLSGNGGWAMARTAIATTASSLSPRGCARMAMCSMAPPQLAQRSSRAMREGRRPRRPKDRSSRTMTLPREGRHPFRRDDVRRMALFRATLGQC